MKIEKKKKLSIKKQLMNIDKTKLLNCITDLEITNKSNKSKELLIASKLILKMIEHQNFLDKMKTPINLKYPIYIPSKINAIRCSTPRLLNRYKISFKIVIEPQDENLYINKWDKNNILILPKNNMGLSYSRNYIIKYSRNIGEKKHWQLDDDIGGFSLVKKNKTVTVNPTRALNYIELVCNKYKNIGMAGPSNSCFPPQNKTKEYNINKLIASCILIDNSCKSIIFEIDRVEDFDCCLTVLFTKYWCTLKFINVLMSKANDLQFSGNYEAKEKYNTAIKKITKKWPKIFKINKQGRLKTNIWSKFKQKPIKIKRKKLKSKLIEGE